MSNYSLDSCAWKKCTQESTIIFYGIGGLCDKHTKTWFETDGAFGKVKDTIKIFLTKSSPDVKAYYKTIKDDIRKN